MAQHPDNRIIFVSGGSRSGKSRYAEQRATALSGQRSYIATCPVIDEELEQRIAHHRRQRADQDWHTIEEPVDLLRALHDCRDSAVVLVDCLTLWLSNLMAAEHDIGGETDALVAALAAAAGPVVVVTTIDQVPALEMNSSTTPLSAIRPSPRVLS